MTEEHQPEETSAFLSEWQKRHQEYLEEQEKNDTLDEDEKGEELDKSLTAKAKWRFSFPKREQSEETEDDEEEKTDLPPISRKALWQSVPVFVLSLLLLGVSLYFISPYSKEKTIVVEGNQQLSTETVEQLSQISAKDYVLTTYLSRDQHANLIEKSSLWVRSATIHYRFPNQFTITLEEYSIVAYIEEEGKTYPVLSNGEISQEIDETIPEQHTTIHLLDKELIQTLVLQLVAVDETIRNNIQTIDLTPSNATPDLLTLAMYDGNKVIIPLSEIEKKLPYYTAVAEKLTVPSAIDMEVGVFSYAN